MGTRTSFPPGAFSWVDLATTDAEAAKAFYGTLFGWEMEDVDAGGGNVYTTCRLGGAAVAGLFAMTAAMRSEGMAPNWTSYVTVEDANTRAGRAAELGGTVVDDAFDVLDVGRMAVVRDPQGAVFALWQAGTRIGAERVNDVGCMCMNELMTSDLDSARSFYEPLFGWTSEVLDGPDGRPLVFASNDGRMNASMFTAPEGVPPHWRACFSVASTDDAIAQVHALGGQEVMAPVELDNGSLAVVSDPHGAVFSVFAGPTDD
jgi:uncharacterized protein